MKTDQLFTKHYYATPGFVDGTSEFHQLVDRFIPSNDRILEIGPGPSNVTSRFLASRGSVIGVDVSSEVFDNSWLAEAKVYDGNRLPFRDASFQLCVSDYVLEHLSDPQTHFREIERVLRPGGLYCFRTPNLWHYVAFGSRILPYRAHLALANRLRGLAANAHEPYPTVYAANTRGRICHMARAAGLSELVLRTIEKEPSYGRASPVLFFPMMIYERLVNSSPLFEHIRMNILGVLEKRLQFNTV